MKSSYVVFLRRLLIFSAITGVVFMFAGWLMPKEYQSPATPFLFFFFVSTTLLSYLFLLRSIDQKLIRFVNTFLLTIIFKLLLYIVVVIGYVFLNRFDAVPFMITFFILYICYTAFETVMVVKASNSPAKSSPQA